jgi:hypothetical protein
MRLRRGTDPSRLARLAWALDLRAMHGMLSAALLICVFAAVTAACAYVAGRVYLAAAAGKRQSPQRRQSRRGDSS